MFVNNKHLLKQKKNTSTVYCHVNTNDGRYNTYENELKPREGIKFDAVIIIVQVCQYGFQREPICYKNTKVISALKKSIAQKKRLTKVSTALSELSSKS